MKKALLLTVCAFVALFANAQKLPFQGKLIESGTPVNGSRTFVFEIAAVEWSETHTDVAVTDGLYFVVLGNINPLPDSLFYGVDEQNMTISVNGTALSPVILFKPLSSPFEGSELTVRNGVDTIVGRFFSRSDNLQSGELLLKGPNGSPNVRAGSNQELALANDGGIYIYDADGNEKAKLYSEGDRSFLNVLNKYGSGVTLSSSISGTNQSARLIMGAMNTGVISYNGYSYQDSNTGDTMITSSQNLYQYNKSQGALNFRTFTTPYAKYMYQDGKLLSQYLINNWGGMGYSGYFDLRGPNSTNIEMSSKHWVNADLPWFKMVGSQNQDAVQLSVSDDESESAYLNLFSRNEKEASFYTTGIRFNRGGENWREFASINVDNRDNNGDAGYFILNGPNSGNFWMGAQHWIPGKGADRPLFSMSGSADQPVFSVECSNDDTNEEALVHLYSQIGNVANLYPTLFEMKDANRTYSTFRKNDWGNGSFGMIELAGPNSSNFEFSSYGGNPDRGYMALRGATGDNRVEIFANEYNGNEYGQIVTRNADGVQSVVTHEEFLLTKPDWTMLASLYNGGDYGQLTLRGPSTQNFYIGSENWGNHDVPYMNMTGKDDQNKMYLTTIEDGNGERGIITLSNSNGEETTYANNGTWGTGPFNMWSGAMVNGTLTINGNIEGSGTNNYNSDRRLKKDIQSLGNNTIQKITQLGGYSYYWRKDEFPKKNFSDDQQIGLIAQELEEQFPALVKTGDDGFKSVNYNGFTAVLLEAVKELNAKVDKLESENNRLQAELSASASKSDEMDELKKQVDLLTKLVQEKMADSDKTAAKN